MSTYETYIADKRVATQRRRERVLAGELGTKELTTKTTVQFEPDKDGVIGVRRTSIRSHEIITDSVPDLGGFDAGPSPVELLLAAIGGCVTHTFMLQAAARRISYSDIRVDVTGTMDPRSGTPGHESTPNYPTGITITTHVTSDDDPDQIRAAIEAAEQICPVSAALRNPVTIASEIVITSRHSRGNTSD